jgi:hypothetical protein
MIVGVLTLYCQRRNLPGIEFEKGNGGWTLATTKKAGCARLTVLSSFNPYFLFEKTLKSTATAITTQMTQANQALPNPMVPISCPIFCSEPA